MDVIEARRRILMNAPHIVTPTPAGLMNFSTDMKAPLKECKVHFSPVQEGTGDPSPENVRPISGWMGIEVTRCGKNMLPAVADSITKSGVTYAIEKDSDGSITRIHVTGTSTSNSSINTIANDLILPPGNYTLTAMTDGDGQHDFNLRKKGTSTDIVQRVSPKTFSISETTAYQSAYVYCKNGNTFDFYVYPMIRLSSIIDDTFEPYSGTTLPLDWSDSAGTVYGGYVDLVSGEVWAEDVLFVIDKDTPIKAFTVSHGVYKAVYALPHTGANANAVCCNKFALRSRNTASSNYPTQNQMCCLPYNDVTIQAEFGLSNEITTQQAWIDWLSENGELEVVYPLATPTLLTTLTPTALRTLIGTNNIWSNANGNIDLSYWTH